MSIRSGAPPKTVGQWLHRKAWMPLRKANRKVKIATRILSIYRLFAVAFLAIFLGVTLSPGKKEQQQEGTAGGGVFNVSVEKIEPRPTNPAAAPLPKITLRGYWAGFKGVRYERKKDGAHLVSGKTPSDDNGGIVVDKLPLYPAPGTKIFFRVENKGKGTDLRMEVNDVRGPWQSVPPGRTLFEIPLTREMLAGEDGNLKKLLILFPSGAKLNLEISPIQIK